MWASWSNYCQFTQLLPGNLLEITRKFANEQIHICLHVLMYLNWLVLFQLSFIMCKTIRNKDEPVCRHILSFTSTKSPVRKEKLLIFLDVLIYNTYNKFTFLYISQYKFYQGLNFQAVFTTGKPTKTVFQVENSYLPDFPQGLNAAPDTESVFCKNVHLSQVDLSAETRAQTPNTQHTIRILRNTHTAHITRKTTHLHTLWGHDSFQSALCRYQAEMWFLTFILIHF